MIFESITLHDFTRPLRARLELRKVCGPYTWRPGEPGESIGFYMSGKSALAMGDGPARLRLMSADEHSPSRLRGTYYYGDEEPGFADFHPIVARLPHGRGFLAGWTMGKGMCSSLDLAIHDTPEEAAYAAHEEARIAAEREQEYRAEERAKLDEEERAAQAREDEVAGLGTEE